MTRRIASKLARWYRVPIGCIYKDTVYWENTVGYSFVLATILFEEIKKPFQDMADKILSSDK